MKRLRTLWLILPALAVIALLVYAFWPAAADAEVARVRRGGLLVTVDEDGKTRIKERYVVAAPLAGQLLRLDLEAGDPLTAGKTVLAVIEPGDPQLLDVRAHAEAEARVKSAEASRRRAAANLDRARANQQLYRKQLARAESLLPSKGISVEELEIARANDRIGAAEVHAAEFAVQVAGFELETAQAALLRIRPRSPEEPITQRLELRAPINGKVLRVMQKSARRIQAGTPLCELGDPRNLEIEVDVLSTDAVRIKPGAKVLLERWGGDRPLEARVRVVEPAAFTKTSALGVEEQRVWIIADPLDATSDWSRLGDAYRVEARIVVWEGKDVLKVPAGAVFRHGDGWAVFKVESGRARLQPIEAGHTNGLETEVLGGLDDTDAVVVHPSDRIADGVRIAVQK